MKTIKMRFTNENQNEIFQIASEKLNQGGLVVFPTETVYGIGGNALNPEAVRKIYEAKGRPSDNPLIVHINDPRELPKYAKDINQYVYELIRAFWPGPLTMVFKKTDLVQTYLTGGLDTVAVRIPDNEIIQGILNHSKLPICAPSANTSGRPSATTFDHVVEDLDGKVDMIIDGGKSFIGLESTVLDVTGETPVILRPGKITKENLETVLRRTVVISTPQKKESELAPKSPGMKYKHYAPKADLIIIDKIKDDFIDEVNNLSLDQDTYIIASAEYLEKIHHNKIYNLGSISNLDEISSNVFAAFRHMDLVGAKKIYIQLFENTGIGHAINNRIQKASTKK